MDLLVPHTGTIIWMTIAFSISFFILAKFAWKPILGFLKSRENSIKNALRSAEEAKEEMSKLKADNEQIIAEAKKERDLIIKEARDLKDSIINEAKNKATEEATRILEAAKENIKSEKLMAFNEIKTQVALVSVKIAEKLLQEKLSEGSEQKELIEKLLRQVKLN
ncbi:MAG: F0F1 ATP synthase subunit B [Bacteroidales bacterium]|nr:F0F1 ATP synthase subunit B [Bacteroidales bacterium]